MVRAPPVIYVDNRLHPCCCCFCLFMAVGVQLLVLYCHNLLGSVNQNFVSLSKYINSLTQMRPAKKYTKKQIKSYERTQCPSRNVNEVRPPNLLSLVLITSLSASYLLQFRTARSTDSSSWHPSRKPVGCFPTNFNVLFNAQCPSYSFINSPPSLRCLPPTRVTSAKVAERLVQNM